jgi:hypothetical protein
MKKIICSLILLFSISAFSQDSIESISKKIKLLEDRIGNLESLFVLDQSIPNAYVELLNQFNMGDYSASRAPTARDIKVIRECFDAVKNSKYANNLNKLKYVFLHDQIYNRASVSTDDKYIVIYRMTTAQSCYEEIITKL